MRNMARINKSDIYARKMALIEQYELRIGKLITKAIEENNPNVRDSLMRYLNKAMYSLAGLKNDRESLKLSNKQYDDVRQTYSQIRELKKSAMRTTPGWLEKFSQKYETMRMAEKDEEKKYQLKKAA